ncbi:hypothetical protein D3C85_1078380 [compost metagenome]
MLTFGEQPRQLGTDGRRLGFQGCYPRKLAVLEDRLVPHQRGQRDAVAQPINEAEEDPGIDTGLSGLTRVDGLHNRYRDGRPRIPHFVDGGARAQALRAVLAPSVRPGVDLPAGRKLV